MSTQIRKARNTVVVIACLAAVGASATLLTRDDADPTSTTTARAEGRRLATGRTPGASDEPAPCAFASGSRMAYDVRTATHSVIDMGGLMDEVRLGDGPQLQAESTAVDQAASRQWHVDLTAVARANDGSSVLAAHVVAGLTQIEGIGAQPPRPGLGQTFLVRIDPQCTIREFGWRTDGDVDAARDQQVLLSGLGYLAPTAGQDGYGGMLFDVVGRYYAQYSVQADGTISGHAVDYREPFGQATAGMRPTFDVVRSAIEVTPDSDRWFAALSHEREVSMNIMGEEIGSLHSSVHAESAEPSAWQPSVDLTDGGWTWGLLLGRPTSSTTNHGSSPELVGVTATDAIAQYHAIIADRGRSIDAVPHLVAWLRSNPDGAQEILAALRAGAFDGAQGGAPGIFLALGTAGTDQATDALLSILHEDRDALGHKISAAHALSSVEAPTEAMVDAIVAVADSDVDSVTRGSMAMSLGSFAHHNSERAPELAQRARGQIADWLADPADDADLAGSLLAAGNAGHDGLVAAIEPYFDHDDPQIRQRAAHAMRHMSPDEAFPRLSDGMYDEDPTVRASALETALTVSQAQGATVPDTMVDAAIERLDLTTPEREQKALLGLLGEAAKHGSEGADAVLQQHFADELDAGIADLDKLRALGKHTNTRWTAD